MLSSKWAENKLKEKVVKVKKHKFSLMKVNINSYAVLKKKKCKMEIGKCNNLNVKTVNKHVEWWHQEIRGHNGNQEDCIAT